MTPFETAGSLHALSTLGLLEQEKTAALPLLLRGAVAAGRGLFGLGKGLGKGLWRAGAGAVDAAATPINAAGRGAVNWAGKGLGLKDSTIASVQGLGKNMAREGIGFGLFGGGLEAAFAEPGDRGSAFMRGFGTGALGGLAYRGASNLTTAGMRRAAPNMMAKYEPMAKPGFFGKRTGQSRSQAIGATIATGGLPFAAGTAATFMVPHGGAAQQQQQQPAYQQYTQQYAPIAVRAGLGARGAMGAFPSGYNPNLPLPQGGF